MLNKLFIRYLYVQTPDIDVDFSLEIKVFEMVKVSDALNFIYEI